MIYTTGVIKCRNDNIIAVIDPNITAMYRRLIPPYKHINVPKYEPHITIVRKNIEVTNFTLAKEKFDGLKVRYRYDGHIQYKKPYYFLLAWSEDIMQLRVLMGLKPLREGFFDLHITIGNDK